MAGLPNSSNALQQWHHLFERRAGSAGASASAAAAAPGLPTRKHEDWKYTPLDGY
jgi:Fe-S cluster assembly protein SufD